MRVSSQVFDRDKALKKSMYLASPVNCCCYLNDDGDIIIGFPTRLVVVRANTYQWLGRGDEGSARDSIYDRLRGRGTRPTDLYRADTCTLQHLSTAPLPSHL